MIRKLLYRFFGAGKIPGTFNPTIQSEGLILADEAVKGTLTYLNFKSPNRYSNWRRIWFTASIAATNARILAFNYSSPAIDVPFADERFRQLNFSVESNGVLLVAFDASLFHADWSGNLEYRFFTPEAAKFHEFLTQKQIP